MENLLSIAVFWIGVGLCATQLPKPHVANTQFAPGNPTLTTISLEQPFCVFDSYIANQMNVTVDLYVAQQAAAITAVVNATGKTFQQTSGGLSEAYQAASLQVPNCSNPPSLNNVNDALQRYLFRVGTDSQCLTNNADVTVLCNAPLSVNTVYRFKYLLVQNNGTSRTVLAQTPWSEQVSTKLSKQLGTIDTWPGKRTGGQVVVTTILIVLLFLLLCAFVATMVYSMRGTRNSDMEPTRHVSQITQEIQQSKRDTDQSYSSVPPGVEAGATDRYTPHHSKP